jgi:hypothetical protein
MADNRDQFAVAARLDPQNAENHQQALYGAKILLILPA